MYSKFRKIIGAATLLMFVFIVTFGGGAKSAYAATLADGTYTVDYVIKKPDDESVSMANDYWEKPATVIVNGGAIKVRMTINHSEWVTQFKVPGGSSYTDAKVISSDKGKNTRLVEFSLASLEKPMLSQIHVTVPEIDYDHDYTIRFVYDTNTLKLISEPEPAATPEPAAKATATPKPTTPAKSDSKTAEAAVKQAEGGKESSTPNKSTATPASESTAKPSAAPDKAGTEATKQPAQSDQSAVNGTDASAVEDGAAKGGQSDTDAAEQAAKEPDQQVDNQAADTEASQPTDANAAVEGSAEDSNAAGDQETVELTTALDGAVADDSTTVVAANVVEDSSKNTGVIIISFLAVLLIACATAVVIYRKRKASK